MTKRSHRGIAETERRRLGLPRVLGRTCTLDPDPAKRICRNCGRRVQFNRRTYGPHGRKGHWQHSGDGLAQYRSW